MDPVELFVSCLFAADARGRLKPNFMLDPAISIIELDVLGDVVAGRANVRVLTNDPAAILAYEGVELTEA